VRGAASSDTHVSITVKGEAYADYCHHSFTIRYASSYAMSSNFTVEQPGYVRLSGAFTVLCSPDMPCGITVRQPAGVDTDGCSFTVRLPSSSALSSNISVGKFGSQGLNSSFAIQRASSRDLSACFHVHRYLNLSSSIAVRKAPYEYVELSALDGGQE
jgi:hypothetical protein